MWRHVSDKEQSVRDVASPLDVVEVSTYGTHKVDNAHVLHTLLQFVQPLSDRLGAMKPDFVEVLANALQKQPGVNFRTPLRIKTTS